MPAPLTKRTAGTSSPCAQSGRATVADCPVMVPASIMAWANAAPGRSAAKRSATSKRIGGPLAGGSRWKACSSLRRFAAPGEGPREVGGAQRLEAGDGSGDQRFEASGRGAGDLLDFVVGERVRRDPGAVVRDARHRARPEAERRGEVHLVRAR